MAKFFFFFFGWGETEGGREEEEGERGVGGAEGAGKWSGRWSIQHAGLCCGDTRYLWVQRSLFAGHRGIDFLSMSAPFFRAQNAGDNGKLIHS